MIVTASRALTGADIGQTLLCDASAGPIVLQLPPLSAGDVRIKKIDGTSQCVTLVPSGGAALELGFPRLYLPLEGDAAIMHCDGGGTWWNMAPGLAAMRHVQPVAEHTVTQTFYMIDPSYNGYIMLCDTISAGGAIMIVLPLLSEACRNHQVFSVDIEKFDASAAGVSIVSQINPNTGAGDMIHHAGAVQMTPGVNWKLDLTAQYQCRGFWSDGARWIVRSSNGV